MDYPLWWDLKRLSRFLDFLRRASFFFRSFEIFRAIGRQILRLSSWKDSSFHFEILKVLNAIDGIPRWGWSGVIRNRLESWSTDFGSEFFSSNRRKKLCYKNKLLTGHFIMQSWIVRTLAEARNKCDKKTNFYNFHSEFCFPFLSVKYFVYTFRGWNT